MFKYLGILAILLAGCPAASDDDNPPAAAGSKNTYAAELAWRYLELEVDSDGSASINAEIHNLGPSEMLAFGEEIKKLEHVDEMGSAVVDQAIELAIERGVGPFDLGDEAVLAAMELFDPPTFRSCQIGYTSCVLWSPASTFTLYGASCGSGCVSGIAMDRKSTEACEIGYPDFCDHKFQFPANKAQIDGVTTAYDNWILAYPGGILGEHSGSTTYALMGHGHMLGAFIFIPSASKLQIF